MIPSLVVLATAAMLTGHPGTQVTEDMSARPVGFLGYADIPGQVIHMQPYLINELNNINTVPIAAATQAVLVLGHEATHLRGELNEKKCDAWATKNYYRIARYLGATMKRVKAMKPWVKIINSLYVKEAG